MNCVNNGKDVEGGSPQVKRCIFYYASLVNNFNPNIKNKKMLNNIL